jgi:hypothetical protein
VPPLDWFHEFVRDYLSFTGKCFRHCDKATVMTVLSKTPTSLIGAYCCPDGFVSQVVYFSTEPDRDLFERLLQEQVGSENVSHRDLRVASRHGWELGADAHDALRAKLGEGAAITEVYWTRYPTSEEQKQQAVSICLGGQSGEGCLKLFMHDRNSVERLCPSCRAKS